MGERPALRINYNYTHQLLPSHVLSGNFQVRAPSRSLLRSWRRFQCLITDGHVCKRRRGTAKVAME